jgi:predicted enzyme related to lactoylglutathione lyase
MHEILHIEFDVTHSARSRSFFEGLFEWQSIEFMDTMVVFRIGNKNIGGLQQVGAVSS